MANKDARPDSQAEIDAWLDGLAGRDGEGAAARDGRRVRQALNAPSDDLASITAPPWRRLLEASRGSGTSVSPRAAGTAANEGQWRRRAVGGCVAMALVVSAAWWGNASRDDAGDSRTRGAPSPAGAQWRTSHPQDAARALAKRLEEAGASVTVTPSGVGSLVEIRCERTACTEVNAVLAGLETAVDLNGRLTLEVLPPR